MSALDSLSESDDIVDEEVVQRKKKTRKIIRKEQNKTHEEIKRKRVLGQAYTTSNGKPVAAKVHNVVLRCCNDHCYAKLSAENQIEAFNSFYCGQSKPLQDAYLSRCMEKVVGPRKKTLCPKKPRENIWSYSIHIGPLKINVCQEFLRSLFLVTVKRLRIIQRKLLNNESFEEQRGSHVNRPRNIPDDVVSLMGEHLKSIPHDESHYCKQKTNLLYFDNPVLNVKTLYELFKTYFHEKTMKALKMSYQTYHQYYTSKFSYAVRKPKTDICDFCQECKNKLQLSSSDPCKVPYEIHLRKKTRRKTMRDEFITDSKQMNSKILTLEFDYSQNYPIPKLNVNNQFYKRMFWLYNFNIHVFNDESSYCYTFTECDGTKNANSVVSFLYDCLKKQLQKFPDISTVILLSDATGGQNRNFLMTKFTSWFSRVHNVDVMQLFPVRGHSFSQCDRNFGLISNAIRKKEVIGNPKPYLTAMVLCRKNPMPFEVLMDPTLLHDWEPFLNNFFIKKPVSKRKIPFTLMKYVIIKSLKNGALLCSKSYIYQYELFSYWRPLQQIANFYTVITERCPFPQINQLKVNDVRGLYRFLQAEDVEFIESMINQCMVE